MSSQDNTLLRFAGEERDIGEGEWGLVSYVAGCVGYEHPSGAEVWQWGPERPWYWRGPGTKRGDPAQGSAGTLEEAQRIALGQPALPSAVPTTQHDDGTPAKERAPAIVAETEQARRVANPSTVIQSEHSRRVADYVAFREAVTAPAGCLLVTDMIDNEAGAGILCELRSGARRADAVFGWRMREQIGEAQRWMDGLVQSWDREAGARLRRGGR